jgi:hypothetical protein
MEHKNHDMFDMTLGGARRQTVAKKYPLEEQHAHHLCIILQINNRSIDSAHVHGRSYWQSALPHHSAENHHWETATNDHLVRWPVYPIHPPGRLPSDAIATETGFVGLSTNLTETLTGTTNTTNTSLRDSGPLSHRTGITIMAPRGSARSIMYLCRHWSTNHDAQVNQVRPTDYLVRYGSSRYRGFPPADNTKTQAMTQHGPARPTTSPQRSNSRRQIARNRHTRDLGPSHRRRDKTMAPWSPAKSSMYLCRNWSLDRDAQVNRVRLTDYPVRYGLSRYRGLFTEHRHLDETHNVTPTPSSRESTISLANRCPVCL